MRGRGCAHPLACVVGVACLIWCDAGYVSTDVEEGVQQGVWLIMCLEFDPWLLHGGELRLLWVGGWGGGAGKGGLQGQGRQL